MDFLFNNIAEAVVFHKLHLILEQQLVHDKKLISFSLSPLPPPHIHTSCVIPVMTVV